MMEYKAEYLYLTTIGWKTHQEHEIEIWYAAHAGRFYLCAGGRHSAHWVQNVKYNPVIAFFVEGQQYSGTGRVIDAAIEPELRATVVAAFDAKYGWSDGLFVELKPA